jgi:cold shock CspA family protein
LYFVFARADRVYLGKQDMGKRDSAAKKSVANSKRHDGLVSGSIKWFDRYKGYGFVQAGDGGQDLFLRRRVCEQHKLPKWLKQGMKVRVEYGPGQPGKCQAVTRIELAA